VAFLPLDVRDETQPARIVLVGRVVQALARRRHLPLILGIVFHVDLTEMNGGPGRRMRARTPVSPFQGRNPRILDPMLHCGKASAADAAAGATPLVRALPPPGQSTCAAGLLGFNLNKMG
jgi:hypothetical protein